MLTLISGVLLLPLAGVGVALPQAVSKMPRRMVRERTAREKGPRWRICIYLYSI
jgi:hypothetical protein